MSISERDALIIAALNNARTIARSIQGLAQENRVPGTNALYMTAQGAREIIDGTFDIERLLADAVKQLKG